MYSALYLQYAPNLVRLSTNMLTAATLLCQDHLPSSEWFLLYLTGPSVQVKGGTKKMHVALYIIHAGCRFRFHTLPPANLTPFSRSTNRLHLSIEHV